MALMIGVSRLPSYRRPTALSSPDVKMPRAGVQNRLPGVMCIRSAAFQGRMNKCVRMGANSWGRSPESLLPASLRAVKGASLSTAWSRDLWQQLQLNRRQEAQRASSARVNASLVLPAPSTIVPAVRSALAALPLAHPVMQVFPAFAVMAYAIWGLGPSLRFARRAIFQRGNHVWDESRTRYIMASYVRPVLIWASVLVICRGFDPIVLASETSHAIKERFVNFVRSLSTVLAFAFCTASLTQQVQKFMVERQGSAQSSRNLGVQFVGNTVYTLVWVAAVCLFMELLGFSTQKWITAGGFGTVLLTLAGRELVTNFLSSIMIHATRPFMVNEWVQVKIDGLDISGTVEHVGWWEPTIIRGDDREAVHIPNHKFSVGVVRNLSQKSHWRIKAFFGISHMDVSKIGDIVATMRKVIAKHPQLEQKHLHRRVVLDFVDPENQAMMIQVSCFVKTSHFEEYLRVKEMVLLDLLKVISIHGARLATPIRSVQRMSDDSDGRRVPFRDMGAAAEDHMQRPLLLIETPAKLEQEVAEAPIVSAAVADAPGEADVAPPTSPLPKVEQPAPVQPPVVKEAARVTAEAMRSDPTCEEPSGSGVEQTSASRRERGIAPVADMAALPLEGPSIATGSSRADMESSSGIHIPPQLPRVAPTAKPAVSVRMKASPALGAGGSPEEAAGPLVGAKGALEGLDSMGLNAQDITLLGAAFEKPPANIPEGPLESGPYVGITQGKGDRPLLDDQLLRTKTSFGTTRSSGESTSNLQVEERVGGHGMDASVATSRGGRDTPSLDLASGAVDSRSPLSQKGLEQTILPPTPSSSMPSSLVNDDSQERATSGAAFGGPSKPTGSSPRPQSVEENLVLGVALDGPKRTLELPLDGEPPAQLSSSGNKEDGSRQSMVSGTPDPELALAGSRSSTSTTSPSDRSSPQVAIDTRDRER